MGTKDFMKTVVEDLPGYTVHFGRVRMKPGKPTTFASNANAQKLIFALPGNPVSALVSYTLFSRLAIKKMSGFARNSCALACVDVRVQEDIDLDPERPEFRRAEIFWERFGSMGHFVARSTGVQRSSRLLSCTSASSLLCVPQGAGRLQRGSVVRALLLESMGMGNQCIPEEMSAMPPKIVAQEKSGREKKNEKERKRGSCPCCSNNSQVDGGNADAANATPPPPPPPYSGGCHVEGYGVLHVGVLTCSDRASNGTYRDRGGPEILQCVHELVRTPWKAVSRIVPDEQRKIERALCEFVDDLGCDLVITTGGTGPAPRDVTPEATLRILDRELPGIGERMRSISLRHVDTAILSRQVGGTRGSAVILNMPGSPASIRQILPYIMQPILHCLSIIGGPHALLSASPTLPSINGPAHGPEPSDESVALSYEIDRVNKNYRLPFGWQFWRGNP